MKYLNKISKAEFALIVLNKMRKPKQSILQYRTINGIRYNYYTSNPNCFDEVKQLCKKKGIKFRVIEAQIYVEANKISKLESIQE